MHPPRQRTRHRAMVVAGARPIRSFVMMRRFVCMLLGLLVASGCAAGPTLTVSPSATAVPRTGNDRDLILATTTSTQDSGLLDVLIPLFQQQTGYQVKTVSVGTGAAL